MFAQEARCYIEKLIRLQKKIEEKGYRRIDQGTIIQARKHLKSQLEFYPYHTDDKMRGFWDRNLQYIRALIPGQNYPGFRKIMDEYMVLKNQ